MTQPPTRPVGLKVEAAMASAEINAELVCPLGTPSYPRGTHDYDPKTHNLFEWVNKCMIFRTEAQAKFNEYHEAQGSHDEVYTDGSKMNERVRAAAVISRHFQNGETTCCQLSKRLPDNSTIFAAEAIAITLALNYYRYMGPVHHDIVVYSWLNVLPAGDLGWRHSRTLWFVISWTSSGYWVTWAHMFVSAECQVIVASRVM